MTRTDEELLTASLDSNGCSIAPEPTGVSNVLAIHFNCAGQEREPRTINIMTFPPSAAYYNIPDSE